MQRIILHLDMNSYFASVEQQANPFFRYKPVGVCAYLSANGTIIASSIEAKKIGIKTGCKIREAKRLYPKVILVENDPNKYRSITRKFFGILKSYSSNFEPYSIDEGFLDLTGYVKGFDEANQIATEIRQRIKTEAGSWIKSSIGISFTKFLAKFASDIADIDQTKVIKDKSELDPVFSSYKLTDIWGINFRTEKRLNNLGVYSILDLKNYPLENLMSALGKYGYYLWAHVNGLEIDGFKTAQELISKSIGHSYCLPYKTTDKKYLLSILAKLISKVGQRLRERGHVAYGIYINWAYVSGSGFSTSFKLKKPVQTTDEIYSLASKFLISVNLPDRVRFLAVGVFNLSLPSKQMDLFRSKQDNKLSKALDGINGRYGTDIIYRGRLWQAKDQAQDRIGFRKIEL